MKSTTLFAAISLASVAYSVPIVISDSIEAVAHAHPPAPVAPTRPEHALPEIIPGLDAGQVPIDNRPITPPSSAQPSEVLGSPQPVSSSYLLSLAESQQRAVEFQHDQVEINGLMLPGSPAGRPCHSRMSKEQNDLLVIGLVLTFVLAVVAMETWGALCKSVKQVVLGHGAIRLEDDTEEQLRSADIVVTIEAAEAPSAGTPEKVAI